MGLFLRKNYLLRCWDCLCLLNLIGSLKLSVLLKLTAFEENGAFIRFMKFPFPEVALYLYKSTIQLCIEYCCHSWAGAPSRYLDMLDEVQKQLCRTVGPTLAASLNPWVIVEI